MPGEDRTESLTGGGIVSRPLEGPGAETHGVNGASWASSLLLAFSTNGAEFTSRPPMVLVFLFRNSMRLLIVSTIDAGLSHRSLR